MGLISDHCPFCDAELRLECTAWQAALELHCPGCATTIELAPDPPEPAGQLPQAA